MDTQQEQRLPEPLHPLTLRDLGEHRIIQRTGELTLIRLEGTVAGDIPARIEARLLSAESGEPVSDWKQLSRLTVAKGFWSGTMTLQAGGLYRLDIRSLSRSGKVMNHIMGDDAWGVGDIFAVIGSSTPERWFLTAPGCPTDPGLSVYKGGWRSGKGIGVAAASFANHYIAASGLPLGLVSLGVGGTLLRQWANPQSGPYSAFRQALTHIRPIAGVLLHVGGNDSRSGMLESQSAHEKRLRKLIRQIRRDAVDTNLPVFILGSQRAAGVSNAFKDQWTWVRSAELTVGDDTGVHFAVVTEDLRLGPDSVHLSAESMRIAAERVAAKVSHVMGLSQYTAEGPMPVEATFDKENNAILVRFDLRGAQRIVGRRSEKGITGFRASADGFHTLLAISAAEVVSIDTVRLTAEVSQPSIAIDYLTGPNPDVSNCLYGQFRA